MNRRHTVCSRGASAGRSGRSGDADGSAVSAVPPRWQRRSLTATAQGGQESVATVPDPATRAEQQQGAAAPTADGAEDPAAVWAEHLGGFYDAAAVAAMLERGGADITDPRRPSPRLLALTTGTGQVVYPAFQFRDRQPAPGLDAVLAEVPADRISPWTVASWLCCPEADLGG